MYDAGKKYADITAETGVPMATIISWLHARGRVPSRLKRPSGEVTVDQLLTRLAASEREKGELQAEVRRLKADLAAATEGDVPQVTS
jgi:hypothetical protein